MAINSNKFSEETEKLSKKTKNLQQQLRGAKETIDLLKTGNIDALVVADKKELKVYTETTADKTYRILIEKMHEGAITLNEDGTILYCNSYFANMLNLPLQKVIGTKFINFIDDSSKGRFESLIKQGWENNMKDEIYIYSSDGKSIPLLISLNTLQIDNIIVLSIILTDLSIQNKSQKELRIKNEVLEEVVKLAEIGSWVVDLSTNKVTPSQNLYRIYGLDSVKDSKDLSPFELIHQNDLGLSKLIFETAVKNLSSFDTYTRINTPPNNQEKILHVKGNVISKDGKAFQLIGACQDVSALMKDEQKLTNVNKQFIETQEK